MFCDTWERLLFFYSSIDTYYEFFFSLQKNHNNLRIIIKKLTIFYFLPKQGKQPTLFAALYNI